MNHFQNELIEAMCMFSSMKHDAKKQKNFDGAAKYRKEAKRLGALFALEGIRENDKKKHV